MRPWAFLTLWLTLSIPLTWAQARNDSTNHYGAKEEGWFWYKDPRERAPKPLPPPPEVPDPPPQPPAAPAAVPSGPPMFSVEWLRVNLDKLRDKAIDDPSPKNVRAYYYAQRVMLDKADRFAKMSQMVVKLDPALDENNVSPQGTSIQHNVAKLRAKTRDGAIKHLAKNVGIWFFFDSNCSFCALQVSSVRHLVRDHGFLVKNISIDGQPMQGLDDLEWVRDQGQFRALNLSVTPTLVMAVPPKTFIVLSQGALPHSEVDDRILAAAAMHKLLPPEIEREIDTTTNGILSPEDLNSDEARKLMETQDADSSQWVDYLNRKIQGRYSQ